MGLRSVPATRYRRAGSGFGAGSGTPDAPPDDALDVRVVGNTDGTVFGRYCGAGAGEPTRTDDDPARTDGAVLSGVVLSSTSTPSTARSGFPSPFASSVAMPVTNPPPARVFVSANVPSPLFVKIAMAPPTTARSGFPSALASRIVKATASVPVWYDTGAEMSRRHCRTAPAGARCR